MSVHVILCRVVTRYGEEPLRWRNYARRVVLPAAPFVGLGIILHKGCDPEAVTNVFVNNDGELVCEMEKVVFDGDSLDDTFQGDEQKLLDHMKWETDGWVDVGHLPCYDSPPRKKRQPRNGKVSTPEAE